MRAPFLRPAAAALLLLRFLLPAAAQATDAAENEADAHTEETAAFLQDPYTGLAYLPGTEFTVSDGSIRIDMNGTAGTFCLHALPRRGMPVPLLSTYDSFGSTFFAVRAGKAEHRLNREGGALCEARQTPSGGAQMAYELRGTVRVLVDLSPLRSSDDAERTDMVRVTVYTTNTGDAAQVFSLKGVFDTVLGENTQAHFSTAENPHINSEQQFPGMAAARWVRSANASSAVQFLLHGTGITEPEYVTLSSKDALSSPRWVPSVQDGRSFHSVQTYNNSALAVNWKPVTLAPQETDAVTFYIAVATNGKEPAGAGFSAPPAPEAIPAAAAVPEEPVAEAPAAETPAVVLAREPAEPAPQAVPAPQESTVAPVTVVVVQVPQPEAPAPQAPETARAEPVAPAVEAAPVEPVPVAEAPVTAAPVPAEPEEPAAPAPAEKPAGPEPVPPEPLPLEPVQDVPPITESLSGTAPAPETIPEPEIPPAPEATPEPESAASVQEAEPPAAPAAQELEEVFPLDLPDAGLWQEPAPAAPAVPPEEPAAPAPAEELLLPEEPVLMEEPAPAEAPAAPEPARPAAEEPGQPAAAAAPQLDRDYIRRLLDHIGTLENTPSGITQAELIYLDGELDAILEKLKDSNK